MRKKESRQNKTKQNKTKQNRTPRALCKSAEGDETLVDLRLESRVESGLVRKKNKEKEENPQFIT